MTLVLEALRGDEALDAGGLGVGFFAFAFGLDFAADDEFADLVVGERAGVSAFFKHRSMLQYWILPDTESVVTG